jgi:hypothetical protein
MIDAQHVIRVEPNDGMLAFHILEISYDYSRHLLDVNNLPRPTRTHSPKLIESVAAAATVSPTKPAAAKIKAHSRHKAAVCAPNW